LLLALALAQDARAQGVVRIQDDVSVEGAAITLGEIATLDGFADPEGERLARLSLGAAAVPGRHRVLSGASLTREIAALAPGAALDVPEAVRVHTAYREITPQYVRERLEQAIRHSMPWPAEAIRFADWKLPPAFAAPAHAEGFLVHFARGEDFLGRVSAEVEPFDTAHPEADPGTRLHRSASVELEVRLPVAVAARALARGETLAPEDVRMQPGDLRLLPRNVFTRAEAAIGRRTLRPAAEGTPLTPTHLEAERAVQRGDIVQVAGDLDGIELRADVKALAQGAVGDSIPVENPSTRRRFNVEVTGPGRARLPLPASGDAP
jgi:flagella basal body P-ring formation protein FlgA